MTELSDAVADGSKSATPAGAPGRWLLPRWFVSSAMLSLPQAAGPVAFSLVALSLTGDTRGGAALILAMTLAQVAGAVPITWLGAAQHPATFFRRLVVLRTMALGAMALLTAYGAPFVWLVLLAAVAGSVNGAASGYLRSMLNGLTPASGLPRALGIAATLNEVTFVLAPVAASGLSTVAPVYAVLALAALGAVPALLVPDTASGPVESNPSARGAVLTPAILLWLLCAAAGASAIAAIEIGAVAIALSFGYEPALAILFTVPLCLASVAGGVWISIRNRMASRRDVLIQFTIMTLGAALAALEVSLAATVLGAVLIGSVLAPLATYYSLVLDQLAPPHRRPEVFALLRTANAAGVIFASGILTMVSLSVALNVVTGLMAVVTVVIGIAFMAERVQRARAEAAAQRR